MCLCVCFSRKEKSIVQFSYEQQVLLFFCFSILEMIWWISVLGFGLVKVVVIELVWVSLVLGLGGDSGFDFRVTSMIEVVCVVVVEWGWVEVVCVVAVEWWWVESIWAWFRFQFEFGFIWVLSRSHRVWHLGSEHGKGKKKEREYFNGMNF